MQAAIAAKDAEIERLTTENAALKQQLLSNGLVPGAAPSHKELPAALQNFVPLANAPAVQAVLPALDAATEAVGRAADAAALDAAIEALRAVGETAVEAYAAAIAERVAQPDCISSCQEALIAGDGKFEKVYDVVWGYIEASEDARALPGAADELRAAAAAPAGAKPTQHVADLYELYRAAAKAQPAFRAACGALQARLDAAGVRARVERAPLKNCGRIIEKMAFAGDAARRAGAAATILDVNRAMLVCEDARAMRAALHAFTACASAGDFAVARVKDRHATPSPGGWRDALVNVVVGDHVCEFQVVHQSMLVARVGLDGHGVYDRIRNCAELLEKLGMLGSRVNETGAGWSFDMGAPSKPKGKKPVLSSSRNPRKSRSKIAEAEATGTDAAASAIQARVRGRQGR